MGWTGKTIAGAFLVLVFSSGLAWADTITLFDNGAPVYYGANGVEVDAYLAADDFVLGQNSLATGAAFYTLEQSATEENANWDGTLQWYILADGGGSPTSTIVYSGTGYHITKQFIGDSWFSIPSGQPYKEYMYSFDFGSDLALQGGVSYWLALHLNASTLRYFMYWEYSVYEPAPDGNVSFNLDPFELTGRWFGGICEEGYYEAAFKIFGTTDDSAAATPEPGSLALMASGAGAWLAWRGRRSRAKSGPLP